VAQWIAFQPDMLRTVTLRLVTSWVNIFPASLSWNSDTTSAHASSIKLAPAQLVDATRQCRKNEKCRYIASPCRPWRGGGVPVGV